MKRGLPFTKKAADSECVRRAQVGRWGIELLPRAPYEASYTPEQSIIGYSFDSQVGTHAFASDKRKEFHAVPNGLAWVPAGCDIYSQSVGGEYLKISCSNVPYRVRRQEQHFSDVVNPTAIDSAFALRRALMSEDSVDHIACENWLMAMESSVATALLVSHNQDHASGWMNVYRHGQIVDFIDAHLDTQLTVSKLASEFDLSMGFFSREFKNAFGRTPHQYIVDRRLASARLKLYQSQSDLSAIAFDCGFSSHSHMTALFRERFGVAPTQLRRKAQECDR